MRESYKYNCIYNGEKLRLFSLNEVRLAKMDRIKLQICYFYYSLSTFPSTEPEFEEFGRQAGRLVFRSLETVSDRVASARETVTEGTLEVLGLSKDDRVDI